MTIRCDDLVLLPSSEIRALQAACADAPDGSAREALSHAALVELDRRDGESPHHEMARLGWHQLAADDAAPADLTGDDLFSREVRASSLLW